MKRNGFILIAVIAAILLVLFGKRLGGVSEAPTSSGGIMEARPGAPSAGQTDEAAPKKGSPAPAFRLSSLDGKSTYEVQAGGKREKPLIVNFWASWCGPCEMEAPDLVALYNKYKDKLDLYAVNATKYDRLNPARDFVKQNQFTFPVLTDAAGDAEDAYVVYSYPTSFIIDRNGRIAERIEGVIPVETWEKYLDEVTKT